MAEGFHGRIKAYEEGLDGNDAVLAGALARNLFGTAPAGPEQIDRVAAYMRREADDLAGRAVAPLLAGNLAFGLP
jgi:cytochrome b pre-mRNA-processing protein 3